MMKNISKNKKTLAIVSFIFISMFLCGTIFNVKMVNAITPVPNIGIEPTTDKPYVLETPFGTVDYVISKYSNGSYYGINMSSFNNFIVTTNCSLIFNTIISSVPNNGNVSIKINAGNYELTNNIQIPNTLNFDISGAGSQQTTIDRGSTTDAKIFEITDSGSTFIGGANDINIHDLTLRSSNGYCIHYDISAQSSYQSLNPNFKFNNINMFSKYGIKINSLFNSQFNKIRWWDNDVDNSKGIWLLTTSPNSQHYGNSVFNDIQMEVRGENSIGIYIDSTKSTSWINLLFFYGVYMTGHFTTQTGIYLNCSLRSMGTISFIHIDGLAVELKYGIWMDTEITWIGNGQIYDVRVQNFYLGCTTYNIYAIGYGFWSPTWFVDGFFDSTGTQTFTSGGGSTFGFARCSNTTAYSNSGYTLTFVNNWG